MLQLACASLVALQVPAVPSHATYSTRPCVETRHAHPRLWMEACFTSLSFVKCTAAYPGCRASSLLPAPTPRAAEGRRHLLCAHFLAVCPRELALHGRLDPVE